MTAPVYNPTAPRLRPFPGARAWDRSNPWVYLGTLAGTKLARARRGALVAPLDADPMSFTWPAHGLEITLIGDDTKRELSLRVARALLRDGAKLVACVLPASCETLFRYSHDQGAEQ